MKNLTTTQMQILNTYVSLINEGYSGTGEDIFSEYQN